MLPAALIRFFVSSVLRLGFIIIAAMFRERRLNGRSRHTYHIRVYCAEPNERRRKPNVYGDGTGKTRWRCSSRIRLLEAEMLLLFWMPMIVASAMLEPLQAKKVKTQPVKRQED